MIFITIRNTFIKLLEFGTDIPAHVTVVIPLTNALVNLTICYFLIFELL